MATTNIAYAVDTAITLSAWTTSLANGQFAYSDVVDNSSNKYMDAYVGGDIAFSTATGGPIVAGDSMDIYVVGQYSDTATDLTGAIDALAGWDTEEAEDTAFVLSNNILLTSIAAQSTTPDTTQDLHFGPIGIAQFFGGILPKKWGLLLHNNTAATLGSGSSVNYVGITYTTTA